MSNKHSSSKYYTMCSIVGVGKTRRTLIKRLDKCIKLIQYTNYFIPFHQSSSSRRLRNALTVRYIFNLLKMHLLEVEQIIVLFQCCDRNCFEIFESQNEETIKGRRYNMRKLCNNEFFKNYIKNLKRELKTMYYKFLDEPQNILDCTEMQSKLVFRSKLFQVALTILRKEIIRPILKLDEDNECENLPQGEFLNFYTSHPFLTVPFCSSTVCSFCIM